MKLGKLTKIINDETVLSALKPLYGADAKASQDIKGNRLVAQLFSVANNVETVSRAIDALRASHGNPGSCKRLLSRIQSYALKKGASHGIEQSKLQEFVAKCADVVEKKKSKHLYPGIVCTAPSPQILPGLFYMAQPSPVFVQPVSYAERYASFMADKNWRLADFDSLQQFLSADDFSNSKELQKQISELAKDDPEVQKRSLSERFVEIPGGPVEEEGKLPWNATYDYNRIGSQKSVGATPVTLNWTDMAMPLQRYFVGGCPFTKQGASVLFDHMIAERCPVIVSAHQLGEETAHRFGAFWKKEMLKDVVLQDGWSWSLDECTSEVLTDSSPLEGESSVGLKAPQPAPATGPQEPMVGPYIVKSKLVARKGEEVYEGAHFHYVGWDDFTSYPDLPLFLLAMTHAIHTHQRQALKKHAPRQQIIPFAANCKGGVGRSGMIIVFHHLLMEIIDQLEKRVPLDKVQLNILERFCQMRKQRRIFLTGSHKIVDILSALSAVYKIIQTVGVERFLKEKDLRLPPQGKV